MKRKKNDSIVFDSWINSQYEIQIVNKKISIKNLKEDKLNNIIFLLPYLRIKKHIKYLNLEIDKNKIEINNKKFKISNQKNVNLYKKEFGENRGQFFDRQALAFSENNGYRMSVSDYMSRIYNRYVTAMNK